MLGAAEVVCHFTCYEDFIMDGQSRLHPCLGIACSIWCKCRQIVKEPSEEAVDDMHIRPIDVVRPAKPGIPTAASHQKPLGSNAPQLSSASPHHSRVEAFAARPTQNSSLNQGHDGLQSKAAQAVMQQRRGQMQLNNGISARTKQSGS